jgi:hypothetical protein
MKLKYIVLSFVFPLIFINILSAGDLTNIRGIGMAGTMNAVSNETDAIGINPANIALPGIGYFTLTPAPVGVKLHTELFSYDIYSDYFTGMPGPDGTRITRLLTEKDKNTILSQLPDVARTTTQVEFTWFSFSFQHPVIGGIGFAVTEHAGASIALSKDFFRTAAFGLDSLGSQYKYDGTDISAWWYREYNVSYGRKLPFKPRFVKDLFMGISIKFIRGRGIFTTDQQNSSFGNYSTGIDQYALRGNFDFLTRRAGVDFFGDTSKSSVQQLLFSDPAGKGTGFDFGISSEIRSGLRVAFSVTDIGSITWDKNVYESIGGGQIDVNGIYGAMEDSLRNAAKGSTLKGSSFKTSLPTTLRFGAAMDAKQFAFFKFIPGKLLLAFDYTQGLNNSLGNTTIPRFSLGIEYRVIRFIPIRTGLSVGGGEGFRWALGTGFNSHYFSLDLATENFGMFFIPKSFQMVSLSLGIKIRV